MANWVWVKVDRALGGAQKPNLQIPGATWSSNKNGICCHLCLSEIKMRRGYVFSFGGLRPIAVSLLLIFCISTRLTEGVEVTTPPPTACSPNPCRNGGTCIPGDGPLGFNCRWVMSGTICFSVKRAWLHPYYDKGYHSARLHDACYWGGGWRSLMGT